MREKYGSRTVRDWRNLINWVRFPGAYFSFYFFERRFVMTKYKAIKVDGVKHLEESTE